MTEKHSFWSTIPGILTGLAGMITALGGLLLVLFQTGLLGGNGDNGAYQEETTVKQTVSPNVPSEKTPTIAIDVIPPRRATLPPANGEIKRINLLSSENGGQLLVADSNTWLATIDGKERQFSFFALKAEAVFGFKDERPVTFDIFTVLVEETDRRNLKKFELLVGNESPTGLFTSIGKFETLNKKLFNTPYQEFKFQPVTAKYLKVKLLSAHEQTHIQAREFQLMGNYQ